MLTNDESLPLYKVTSFGWVLMIVNLIGVCVISVRQYLLPLFKFSGLLFLAVLCCCAAFIVVLVVIDSAIVIAVTRGCRYPLNGSRDYILNWPVLAVHLPSTAHLCH